MNRHSLTIHYSEIPQKLLTPADATLVARALEAAQDAYAPFSKFGVGAAVLLDDGQIFTGKQPGKRSFSCRYLCRTLGHCLYTCQLPPVKDPNHSHYRLALRHMQAGFAGK